MMPLPLFANSPVVINSNNGCGVCEQWQIDELNGWISDAVEEEYHKDIDSIYVFHIFHLDILRISRCQLYLRPTLSICGKNI